MTYTWQKTSDNPETWVNGNKTVTQLCEGVWEWNASGKSGAVGSKNLAIIEASLCNNRVTVYSSLEDFREAQRKSRLLNQL